MTASKTSISLLTRIRRTITRTIRKHVFTTSLTLSLPPFFKLEIKAEPKTRKPAKASRPTDR